MSKHEWGRDKEWEIGKAKLTLYKHNQNDAWFGIIRQSSKLDLRFSGNDRDGLITEMEADVSKPPPKIVGYAGAMERFLFLYPGGFTNVAFEAGERGGKLEAGATLQPLLDDGLDDGEAIALLKSARRILERGGQSPLHMTESSDLDIIWSGEGGADYVRGVKAWALGDRAVGIKLMFQACEGRRHSWPMFTLFPALLQPDTDAILRPSASQTFSHAVKSVFVKVYDPEPSVSTYTAFLELLNDTSKHIAELGPRDYIDLASFVWVSTSYSADAAPRGVG